jgi:hypothetical protein
MIMARWKIPYKIRHTYARHVLYKGIHFHYEAQNHTQLSLHKLLGSKKRRASESEKRHPPLD